MFSKSVGVDSGMSLHVCQEELPFQRRYVTAASHTIRMQQTTDATFAWW